MSDKYNHTLTEKKWQDKWEDSKIYVADIGKGTNSFYNLWMFPYPSAEGLHAGHAFASTGSDVFGRFQRMQGREVFQPIGYDSFGIHSENYAIKINEDPHKVVKRTTRHYEEQMRSLGHGYDWTRTVTTSDPVYYRWTEWLFSELFKAGLAYRKKAEVNFCPKDKTVLADEQVMTPKQAGKDPIDADGNPVSTTPETRVCERCGCVVEKRALEQWFFRITDYADRLLDNLGKIDWTEKVKVAQKEWIGLSRGMVVNFKKDDGSMLPVFTTRPDTLNAVTFIAVSDEEMWNKGQAEKTGKDTGERATDPLSGRSIPIWKTNYVAPGYGTGAVMGVPAHDERDMEFAKKYHLDIIKKDPDVTLWKTIEENGWGRLHTNYHLRDWLISRQRYWGAPIPMIFCKSCAEKGDGWIGSNGNKLLHKSHDDWNWQGWWPDENLPVVLPDIKNWKPEGDGRGPLATHPEFYEVKCPQCGSDAKRETDVSDTFLDSSWYFLAYPNVVTKEWEKGPGIGSEQGFINKKITGKWLPVDLYFGGAEHSVLHLMYARFVTQALFDLGYLNFEEPFPKFFAHGLMIKDGAKMSKSRGNVVNPDEYIRKFGADAFRLYVMFIGPMDASPDFRDMGIEGMVKFINRIWTLYGDHKDFVLEDEKDASDVLSKLHQTIKKVTDDVSNFKYNTAISGMMELVNTLYDKVQLSVNGYQLTDNRKPATGNPIRCAEWDETLKDLCLMLAPFAPHLAEELWVEILKMPFSVHREEWPKYDAKLIKMDQSTLVIQFNGKVRGTVIADPELSEEKVIELIKADEKIEKWFNDKPVKKVIFIPGKLINFVI